MRPQLFHIPIQWMMQNVLALFLGISAILLLYIVWKWIFKQKDFPSDAAFFCGVFFIGGILLHSLKGRYEFPTYVPIYSYGFMLMIGFGVGIFVAVVRGKKMGIDSDTILDLSMYVILAGVVGARFFYVFIESRSEFHGKAWEEVFKIWRGGLTYYGGLIGAMSATLLYLWIRKISISKVVDLLSPSAMIGLGFGRIGCFLNGCCWGKPIAKDSWLPAWTWPQDTYCYAEQIKHGVIAQGASHSVPVYFTQLYSAVMAFSLGIGLILFARYLQKRQGSVLGFLLVLYSLNRFIIEVVRGDNAVAYMGNHFTISQMVSLSSLLLGLGILVYVYFRNEPVERGQSPKESVLEEGGSQEGAPVDQEKTEEDQNEGVEKKESPVEETTAPQKTEKKSEKKSTGKKKKKKKKK